MSSLVVEFVDLETRSIELTQRVPADCVAELQERFGCDLTAIPLGANIPLEDDEAEWLLQNLRACVRAHQYEAWLRAPHWLDELPYEVNTGRELRLMLEGRKPLAVFSDAVGVTNPRIFPEDVFAPHVESGRIVCVEIVNGGVRRLHYALPSERWRIDAYLDLWQEAGRSGWDDRFERREGELLGYEQRQVDFWLQFRSRRTTRSI